MKITNKTKSELFNALKKENNLFNYIIKNDFWLKFLNEIWNLRAMPSEDPRYSDAYDDIVQHIVNNDDWSIDQLFIVRLKLFKDDKKFIKFLETIVKSQYRENEDEVVKFVLFINSYIEKEQLILTITDYVDTNQAIYSITQINNKNEYIDLATNKIPIYVISDPTGRNDEFSSHQEPANKPAILLVYNNGWNDYGSWTLFSLFFYKNNVEKFYVGETKITNGENQFTSLIIPKTFYSLPYTFCSLGQDYSFYQNLKIYSGKQFESILFALKDSAFFSEIHDKFEKNPIFRTSLLRFDTAEKLLREAKHKVYNYDLKNLYGFKYLFNPKYSKEEIEINFDFDKKSAIPNRIFAIIGKNGTGKTQLITKLPIDISNKNNNNFIPRPPLFSKVIAVSYSIFDNFDIPNKTSTFNYVYCGLSSLKNGKREILTPKQQLYRFHNTWKKINSLERMTIWKNILQTFINKSIVDTFLVSDELASENLTFKKEEFNKVKNKLSSGQNILLYIISEIISNIRYDSLILFDEPETHLHPNAISELMNLIYELVEEFDSYCIISTHSPLIIQELLSRNVYVLDRNEDLVSIRKIGIESFGENLTNLTEEVFGNKSSNKQYKLIIDKLIKTGLTYSNIIEKLESDSIPLSLNTRLYIKSQIKTI